MDLCAKYAHYLILEYLSHFVLFFLIGLLGFELHNTYYDAAFTCNLHLLALFVSNHMYVWSVLYRR